MKKLFFTVVVFIGFVLTMSSQEISPHAIGIRTGDNDGFSNEISYQRKISDTNRFELDLGFRDNKNYDTWKLSGIYQWVFNIDGGFNWYAGFGAGIGVQMRPPLGSGKWKLYRLDRDPSELYDQAEAEPELLKQLIEEWHAYAREQNVWVLERKDPGARR